MTDCIGPSIGLDEAVPVDYREEQTARRLADRVRPVELDGRRTSDRAHARMTGVRGS